MHWDLVDWVCAFMLFSFGLASYILLSKGLVTRKQRLMVGGAVAAVTLLIWSQLAVGIID